MVDDRLNLEARFNDRASAGVRKLGKTLGEVKPTAGMLQARKWMSDFRGGTDKVVGAIRPVSGMLNSVGVGGLAASLSMAELVKQFKELADSTLTLKELSRQSRISMDDLRRLEYVATKFHVDPKAMDGAVGAWSAQFMQFRRHFGDFYEYVVKYNADVAHKIASENPLDALKDTMDYLSRIKDPQIQKSVAAMAGLGDIVPVLGKGPDGLAAGFAEAAQEVKPVTQAMIDAAEKMNESTTRMNQTWSNFKNDVGPSVIDPLTHAIDSLDDTLKLAAKFPGDAAASAGVVLGAAATLYARYRIMRGSALSGGGGAMGRAAGEMAGAAAEQKIATTTFAEAVAEFRLGVREIAARGGAPGATPPGSPGIEPPKPPAPENKSILGGGGWKGLLGFAGETGFQAWLYSEGKEALRKVEDRVLGTTQADHDRSDNVSPGADLWRLFQEWKNSSGTTGGGARQLYSTPAIEEDRASRARDIGGAPRESSGGAPVAVTAQELFERVKDGSKAGIVAGLREMAQEQELDRKGGAGLGGTGIGIDGGAPNMRRGRGASGKWRSTPGTEGGAPLGQGAVGGVFKGGRGAAAGVAKESYDFWRGKGLDHNAALSMVAQEEGESGFDYRQQRGDSGLAHGAFSWHPDRRAAILRETGINIDTASHLQQLEAAWHEGTKGQRAGFFQSLNGRELRDAVYQGVHRFEGSRYQMKDTAARLGFARKWDGGGSFLAPKPAPSTPGAGTPAPSAAAVSDAERFAAQQRIINGSRNPADRELIERYKQQQNTPPGHRAGGWIRGPGTGTSDSIPAMLSNGEYVVNARASGRWLPLLHAINEGRMSHFADGGAVGFGVPRQFYPKWTPAISPAEGRENRRSWRDFFRRSPKEGGMGASWRTTFGAMAMLQGESGRGLNSKTYGWDVNGPSGGVEQWHDVTEGKWAGKLHRLSDLMTFAMQQHADWKERTIQQAFKKHEDSTSFRGPWLRMLAAKTARGALKEGIDHVEIPADKPGELQRRLPNIIRLQREAMADGAVTRHDIDPVEVNIRHHPHTGKPIVTARAGRGVKLGIKTMPTMRPT